jgi:hypothetical protein
MLWMRQSTRGESFEYSDASQYRRSLMPSVRALRAIMHIKSPDRSRSGSAQLFGGAGREDAELAKSVFLSESRLRFSAHRLARAIAASLQESTSNGRSGEGSSNGLDGLTEDEMLAMYVVSFSLKLARMLIDRGEVRSPRVKVLRDRQTKRGATRRPRKANQRMEKARARCRKW